MYSYGLGFLGNLLSLIVFYFQKEFRKISTGLLFIFISISNFFHLVTLAIEFLTIYNIIVFRHVFFQCQFTFFIQNVSRAASTYFMVTVSIDRLIRSEFPMRSRTICTQRNAIIITCCYLIIFSLFWSFFLYPFVSQNPITGTCNYQISASYYYFISYIHVPIRAVFICFIPVIIMLLANIRMLMNIRQSRRRVMNVSTVPSSETNIPLPNASNTNTREKKDRRMSKLDRMLYYMMIANISIFVVTQIPFHIYSCIKNNLIGLNAFTAQLIRAILLIWSSLYFGIAFYFYCLASPFFREKFIKITKKIFFCQTIPPSRTDTPVVKSRADTPVVKSRAEIPVVIS
jgi:hypothetical protein